MVKKLEKSDEYQKLKVRIFLMRLKEYEIENKELKKEVKIKKKLEFST